MTAISDTFRLVNRWKEAGIPDEQAGKMVASLNEELEHSTVSKTDLAELELKIYKAMLAQAFAIVGVLFALIKLI